MKLTAIYRSQRYTLEVDPKRTLGSALYPVRAYCYYRGLLQFEDVPIVELFYEDEDATPEPTICREEKTVYIYDDPITTSRETLEKVTRICEGHTWTYETRTRLHIVHPVYEEMSAYVTFDATSQQAEFTIHNKISTRDTRARREYLTSRGYYDGWQSHTGPQETWYIIETASYTDKLKSKLEPLNYPNIRLM